MLLDLMPMGLLIHTRQGIIFANQEASRLLQVSQNDVVGRHFLDFLQSHAIEAELQIDRAFAGEIHATSTEASVCGANGTTRTIKLMAGALLWDGNDVIQLLLQDITDLKLIQDELHRLTITDELTGAFNRRHAFATAAELLRADDFSPLSVAVLDIDFFKRINDTFGHASGDMAIKLLSLTVKEVLATPELAATTFARIGGEEFIILLPNVETDRAAVICERVRCAIERQFIRSPSGTFQMTVSIGISFRKPKECSFDVIFSDADKALYEAKASGRNRICIDIEDRSWARLAAQ